MPAARIVREMDHCIGTNFGEVAWYSFPVPVTANYAPTLTASPSSGLAE